MQLLLALLGLCLCVDAKRSFPLLFSNYKEIPELHASIDTLRKERAGDVTPVVKAQDLLFDMIETCTSQAYVIVSQPGVQVANFQELSDGHLPLWTHLRQNLKNAGTIGSFPRLDEPLDLNLIVEYVIEACGADVIQANVADLEEPVAQYNDDRPRVITVDLPEATTPFILFRNDEILKNVIRAIPSPFISIIYFNMEGEEFDSHDPKYKLSRRYDIFGDIVRSKRDPTNRNNWEKHASRPEAMLDMTEADPLPPRKQLPRNANGKIKFEKPAAKRTDADAVDTTFMSIFVIVLCSVVLYSVSSLLPRRKAASS